MTYRHPNQRGHKSFSHKCWWSYPLYKNIKRYPLEQPVLRRIFKRAEDQGM